MQRYILLLKDSIAIIVKYRLYLQNVNMQMQYVEMKL